MHGDGRELWDCGDVKGRCERDRARRLGALLMLCQCFPWAQRACRSGPRPPVPAEYRADACMPCLSCKTFY
eukprot:428713-Prymnesium_polylepis.1